MLGGHGMKAKAPTWDQLFASIDALNYRLGLDPPNYPVPAIHIGPKEWDYIDLLIHVMVECDIPID
jgi:hypothetical protein